MEKLPDNNKDEYNKTRVLVVDIYPLMRQALKTGIEEQQDFEVIAEACGEKDTLSIVKKLQPDAVIISIDLFGSNGLDCVKKIKRQFPKVRVLVLKPVDCPYNAADIADAGANGYVDKMDPLESIVYALRAVLTENKKFHKPFSYYYMSYLSEKKEPVTPNSKYDYKVSKLSEREIIILKYLAVGMSNKDIASRLGLSIPSVKLKVSNLFTKLHVSSRTEAVSRGLFFNFLSMDDLSPEKALLST